VQFLTFSLSLDGNDVVEKLHFVVVVVVADNDNYLSPLSSHRLDVVHSKVEGLAVVMWKGALCNKAAFVVESQMPRWVNNCFGGEYVFCLVWYWIKRLVFGLRSERRALCNHFHEN